MSNSAPSLSLPMILRVVIGPALAGVMFAMAFAPTMIRPMAFSGLLLLMTSLKGLSPMHARRAGFIFGAVAYGIGLSWFWNLFGWFSVALIGLLALYTMQFGWGSAVIQRQSWSPVIKVIVTACLWTGIEFARSELLPLNFPWMTIGHALDTRDTAELLSYIGVYGVGLIVMLIASVIQQGRDAWPVTLFIVGLLFIPSKDEKPVPNLTVAAIQSESADFDDFLEKTKALTKRAAIVVWPEQSEPFDLWASELHRKQLLELTAKGYNIVLGTRQQEKGAAWSNIALTVTPVGKAGIHAKKHTVHFFDDGTPGITAVPVNLSQGKVGTPICYDCDYQDVVRHMTLAGAEFFAVPSMDVASWSLKQHLQHAVLMRIRAAENGRWMIVAASSGVSQIIDPMGRQRDTIPPLRDGVLEGAVGRGTHLTFFTRIGWLFPWVALVTACLALLTTRRTQKPVEPTSALAE